MDKRALLHPLVVALLLLAVSTVPLAVASELQPTPHETDTEIVVGIQGPLNNGFVVGYGSDGTEQWRYGNAASYHDVTVLDSGNILTSYASPGETGIRVIDPSGPSVVYEWSMSVQTMTNSEIHDVEPHEDGFVFVDMEYEQIVLLNTTTEETTVLWDAGQWYDSPPDRTKEDWLHINDIDRLSSDQYLISVRNRHQLLVVNTTCNCTEQVINERKDVSVIDSQHNPQWLSESRILVADSENHRIVELEENGVKWEPVWGIREAQGQPFDWPRDADRLPNGNTLITDSRNNRVIEITEQGDVVNIWHTETLPYEADAVAHNEPVGGPTYDSNSVPPATKSVTLPVLGGLFIGLQHAVATPHWLVEYHMIVFLIALALLIAGLSIEVRKRI